MTYEGFGCNSTFLMHKDDGKVVDFVMHHNGLHYHNTKKQQLMLVNTVAKNMEVFLKWQINAAKKA